MKKRVAILLLCIVSSAAFAQGQLKNVFSSMTQVYGGVEESGSTVTEHYFFVAKGSVEISGMLYEGQKIILEKGDTLVVNYSRDVPALIVADSVYLQEPPTENDAQVHFQVFKRGGIYYATVQWGDYWPGSIHYVYRKKEYTAEKKKGFDATRAEYAP